MPDKAYQSRIDHPAYATGVGPPICVDEAHFNFHAFDVEFTDGFAVEAFSLESERAAAFAFVLNVIDWLSGDL